MIDKQTKLSDCLHKLHRLMLQCAKDMEEVYGEESSCPHCLNRSYALEGMAYSVKYWAQEINEAMKESKCPSENSSVSVTSQNSP